MDLLSILPTAELAFDTLRCMQMKFSRFHDFGLLLVFLLLGGTVLLALLFFL